MFIKIYNISGLAISIAPIVVLYVIHKRLIKRINRRKDNVRSDFKFIFTTLNSRDCKQHIYKKTPCSAICSYAYLFTIVQFIESARFSISLCMCLSTCLEIQDALIGAHHRGVKVRFITDKEMAGNAASRALVLQTAEIPIKVQPERGTILHHKFCLADEKHPTFGKLFLGSLNLTCQALTSNWDVIIFTNHPIIIQRFDNEFENLWRKFIYL